jgi:hypothetical protein
MNEKAAGRPAGHPAACTIPLMMVVVVMMVMTIVVMAGPDANDHAAVMMVVMVMAHLHRNLRDPHAVLRALLRSLRFRKPRIVGL